MCGAHDLLNVYSNFAQPISIIKSGDVAVIMRPNIQKLVSKFPANIKSIIQFGSSVSGDFNKNLSDVDLMVLVSTKEKSTEEQIRSIIFQDYFPSEIQAHVFRTSRFIKEAKEGCPIILSALLKGKVIKGKKYIEKLKPERYSPNKFTQSRLLRNSFSALSLGISDLLSTMCWDSVNSIYHAARSAIWAKLLDKNFLPTNDQIVNLLKDESICLAYKRVLNFRENIPDYERDFDLPKKLWKYGKVNEFTDLLKDAFIIIKSAYLELTQKEFTDLFELCEILRKNYPLPEYYCIFLETDPNPFYHVMLSYKDRYLHLDVESETGKIKEVRNNII